MSFRNTLLTVGLLTLALIHSRVSSADEKDDRSSAQPKAESDGNAQPAHVTELIKQLDASRFSQRQQASQKLQDAGQVAIPALAEAAMGESRETTSRAMEILKKHWQTGDEGMKAQAKAALEKIAQGHNAQAARAAEQTLHPKKEEPMPPPGLGGLRIAGQQLRIQIQGAALNGNGKRVTMQNINGVKTIDAQEGNRKVRITDDPNNGIKLEVTETKDGKEETKKYEAKNSDDLKKNHPDAHKLYEEYSKQGGAIQLGGIQIQPGGFPLLPGALPQFPALELPGMLNQDAQRQLAERIEKARTLLDGATQTAKSLGEKSAADEVKKLLDQIAEAKQQLDDAKSKLAPGK